MFIAVKKELCGEFVESSNEVESVFVKINIKGKKSVILGSVYRPPASSYDYCSKSVNHIYNIFNKFKSSVFCIGGDFNLPDINWENSEIVGNQYPLTINQLYLDLSHDLGFNQIVDKPTRGNHILDLLFTNRPEIFKNPDILSGPADHDIVSLKCILKPIRKKPAKRKILLWSKVEESKIKKCTSKMKENFFNIFNSESNVTDIWNFIKKEVESIIETNVPSKTTSTRQHQPWINTKTKRLLRKKQRFLFKLPLATFRSYLD